ncbi:uncharacterized protein [Ptychodera flava]|uniref:uncharacterized protein n=1 Tax=Ptychodera flava TaxID=63121 RepID=UPI003969E4DE
MLPLTNDHYLQAVDVLTKRYGKPQTIINAYMKALWQLEKPTGTLNSLVAFHDNMEGYIRGLNALGKSDDTFGDLLIPIILEKLPANVRKQISRDKGDEAWTLTSLRESIQREIEADRAGETTIDFELDLTDQPPATAAFLTTSKPQHCAFCKKTGHKPTDCKVVTDKTKRLEIVKRDKLCFNCLSGTSSCFRLQIEIQVSGLQAQTPHSNMHRRDTKTPSRNEG